MKSLYLKQGLLACAFLFFTTIVCAQSIDVSQSYWSSETLNTLTASQSIEPQIQATKADYYTLDFQPVYAQLIESTDGLQIELPLGNGEFAWFSIQQNTTMSSGLMESFPGIRSFNIISIESRSIWGKMDVSHNGFRVMIFRAGLSTLFIDPVFHNETGAYMVYQKSDFITDKTADCQMDSRGEGNGAESAKAGLPYNACELNTYRLAVAATGEYTAFHGGDQEDAIAAQITTTNRVNGVYERDFSVTFTIVPNNDLIVYTNAANDPYTNGNPGAMINENQTNINSVIGSANYDIGHVFGTNSGGLAGLGVTCSNNQKARGVTGSGAPINDPFDIDYVAHEMGHQFGGNHSFNNSCGGNRNGGTAVEPGSGSTIMAYAGICDPNVQNNSDDHFHGTNMREIGLQISNDNCQVVTEIENMAPGLADLEEEIYIPIGTPFVLTAEGSDEDGDELTYCWEQIDTEISSQPPVGTSTGGPNFRSNSPILSPSRYFPNLDDLADGGPYTWERVPTVAREMNFRVTVRDNAPGAGCTQYDDLTVVALGDEPFKVVYPSDNGIEWNAFASETILWDVSNTTELPIDAQTVDVFLSVNGGNSYDIQLADDIENDGELTIQVPNIQTSNAYIMVMNSAGTFFDISNFDFTINAIENGFYFESNFEGPSICQSGEIEFVFDVVQIGNFSGEVSLSLSGIPNSSAELSQYVAVVGDQVIATVSQMESTPSGTYQLELFGDAEPDLLSQLIFEVNVIDDNPEATTLQIPENESQGVAISTTLSWEDNATVGMTYTVELALDDNFTDIVLTANELEQPSFDVSGLESETTYFWRVSNQTNCGDSDPSAVFEFTTFSCVADASADVPLDIPIDIPAELESEMEITSDGIIADISVLDVIGTHSQISDLTFTLESPSGTEVVLASSTCGLSLTLESNGDIAVSNPGSIAGTYDSSGSADFAGNIPGAGISGTLVQALDASATPEQLCEDAINGSALNGKIALITRGDCPFVDKVLNAQSAGAIAVIIVNNIPGDGFFGMGGNSNSIDIPAVMISYEDGEILSAELGGNAEGFSFGFDDAAMSDDIPCPATDGGIYLPMEPLSAFVGEVAAGIWKLKINDSSAENGGALTGWNLNICFTDDIVDGVSENEILQALIFPNPTHDLVTIQFESHLETRISLVDIAGRLIESKQNNAIQTQFDLSGLADGIYFIKIEGADSAQSVHKIIKQ